MVKERVNPVPDETKSIKISDLTPNVIPSKLNNYWKLHINVTFGYVWLNGYSPYSGWCQQKRLHDWLDSIDQPIGIANHWPKKYLHGYD